MRVYISGALQASSDLPAARSRYEHAARVIGERGHSAYLPHQHTDPMEAASLSAETVFERDRQQLSDCDGVVAFIDEPSLGVGCELALAHQQNARILALRNEASSVSRFALGFLEAIGASVETYRGADDITNAVASFVDR